MPLKLALTIFQKPEFIKHDNHEVGIKIVYDKTLVNHGAQMVSRDSAISMAIHMFSLAIQEHVTIDKLSWQTCSSATST